MVNYPEGMKMDQSLKFDGLAQLPVGFGLKRAATFDYASLDNDVREFVQGCTERINARTRICAGENGRDLIAVKERLAHGQFLEWINLEWGWSERTAQNMMRIARVSVQNRRLCGFAREAQNILTQPCNSDALDIAVQRAEAGEEITYSVAREIVQEAKASHASQPVEIGLSPLYFTKSAYPEQVDIQREIRREQAKERIEQLREKGVSLPTGKYSCLIVDPPWPMQKIERDVRPNQVEFDYPTMTEEELKAFPLPDIAGDDCHLYLWTTQKHLPMALWLAGYWGFKYQCLLTWVKNVGFTPFSWMYSTEHVLFCTKGSLPLLALGKRLDFSAKVREHSRKPDEFYELVCEVSPGPRLDVFSREKREGFEQYGNEVDKYA